MHAESEEYHPRQEVENFNNEDRRKAEDEICDHVVNEFRLTPEEQQRMAELEAKMAVTLDYYFKLTRAVTYE